MTPTNSDLQRQIDKMNQYSLVNYLKLLGYTPTHVSKKFSTFNLPIDRATATLIVNNKTNRFRLTVDMLDGGIIDLASLLFHAEPEVILADIVPYRLDHLMSAGNGKDNVQSSYQSL